MKKIVSFLLMVSLWFLNAVSAAPGHKKGHCLSPATVQKYLSALPKRQLLSAQKGETHITRQGNILVVEASSELLILPNPFDLKGTMIRFQPAPRNRYTYSLSPYFFNSDASESIPLKDDDSRELIFKYFSFPFAGILYDRCFVNSNGNITFQRGDTEPPAMEDIVNGPPRIAPFFSDLDPENAGTIFVNQTPETVTITWLKVPEFFNQNQFGFGENTFQLSLHKDGKIDLIYTRDITATQALVGITPGGGRAPLRLVDFSKGTLRNRTLMSFMEAFYNYESVDIPLLMQSVYKTIPDHYDFVTLLSNFDLTPVPGAQAFAINVQNHVRGIGNPSGRGNAIFRDNQKYGSAGKLQNITFLGNIYQYPADPGRAIPDLGISLLQILAHEVAHRWLSYIRFSRDGVSTDLLLGRDDSHWSFFLNSEGSFMEGNKILRKTTDSFVTGKPFQKYSDLDLYLMGFIPASEVRSTFLVEGASDFSPDFNFSPDSAPEANVSFRGTALPVDIQNIIETNGPRKPDFSRAQKNFRQLFILITKKERPALEEDLSFAEQLRLRWEEYFENATNGKAKIQTQMD